MGTAVAHPVSTIENSGQVAFGPRPSEGNRVSAVRARPPLPSSEAEQRGPTRKPKGSSSVLSPSPRLLTGPSLSSALQIP